MNIEATADLIMSAIQSDAFDREACVKILRDDLSGGVETPGRTSRGDDKDEKWDQERPNGDSVDHSVKSAETAPPAQTSQPKPESWQEIAREAWHKISRYYGIRIADGTGIEYILAAIERSHAAQPQTDEHQRLELAREAVIDWRAQKLSDAAAMFAVSFAIMPQPKPTEADIERAKAIMAAQPQPSKASPLGERSESPWVGKSERRFIEQKKRSEQYDENALVAKLKPLISDQPPSNLCPLSYSHLPHDYCDGKPTAPAIGDFAKATDDKQEWTEETVKELWCSSGFDDDFLPSKRFRKIIADAHNAALADDDKERFFAFWRENIQLKQELAAERQRNPPYVNVLEALNILTKAYDEKGHPNTLVALATRAAATHQQRLSALAAIAEHNRRMEEDCQDEPIVVDLSALREHDAKITSNVWKACEQYVEEVRKPLMDAMKEARHQLPRKHYASKIIDDALAKA